MKLKWSSNLWSAILSIAFIVGVWWWMIKRKDCNEACHPYESTYQYNKCFCDKSSKVLKKFTPIEE